MVSRRAEESVLSSWASLEEQPSCHPPGGLLSLTESEVMSGRAQGSRGS